MLKIRRAKKNTKETINIAPLIDIIFILLLFFIVTTQFNKDAAMNIDKPRSSTASDKIETPLKIFITAAELIYLDDNKVELIQLNKLLKHKLSKINNRIINIVLDKNVSAGFLISVIDQCKISGFEDIKVSTVKNE